jgi:excisionase family DNA binding protein
VITAVDVAKSSLVRSSPACQRGHECRTGQSGILTGMIAQMRRVGDHICMSEMTASAAADLLGVSQRQVERLARAGDLTVTRTVGGALLLDAASVHGWAQRDRHHGRPWSAATAWAALTLLSGERVDWLRPSALSRLRHRLRSSDASELAWQVRRRAAVHRMQGWGQDTGLVRTGVSALSDSELSALFELSPVARGIDGYVRANEFSAVVAALGLVEDVAGNARVRVVPEDAGYAVGHVLTAAVAVDLSEALDTRESAAGQRVLQNLLEEFRAGDGYLNSSTAMHDSLGWRTDVDHL